MVSQLSQAQLQEMAKVMAQASFEATGGIHA
jgi:hypothetical protein